MPEQFETPDPLPDVRTARWEVEQVLQLLEDLETASRDHVVTVDRVQLRQRSGDQVQESASTVRDARQAITENAAIAIQLRYRFENESWCDTIFFEGNTATVTRSILPTTD